MSKVVKFIISIGLPFLAGGIGSAFTTPAIPNWYASINKPVFTPPGWVFGPAWTTLYILMGISFYLVWSKTNFVGYQRALLFFVIQLVLNALWSILFFGLRQPLYALMEILVLWVIILITLLQFYKIDKTAGLILLPYLAWVSFATLLNFFIVKLN
jgi:tryptophan-rich sensory protein